MPTEVYCYHVNDENTLMHICDVLLGTTTGQGCCRGKQQGLPRELSDLQKSETRTNSSRGHALSYIE